MPSPVSRIGVDLAGPGLITGPGSPNTFVNSIPVSLVGDIVAPHGEPPHTTSTIISGSPNVFVNGRPVTAFGISFASCGHQATTGSPNTLVN